MRPPSVRESASALRHTNASAAPRRSKRRARASGAAPMPGSSAKASAIAISTMGARARNMARQPNASTSAPPPNAALIIPSVAMPAITPSAPPRRSAGNMAVTNAGADAIMSALPTAWNRRSANTSGRVGAKPIRKVAKPYTASPNM